MELVDLICELKDYCDLYDKLEGIYKSSQLAKNKIDSGVLNEIRYSHRAIVDLLNEIINKRDSLNSISKQDALKHIEIALRAVCIAINDTIDLTKDYAKNLVKSFEEDFPNCSISEAYGREEYKELWRSIVFIEDKIAISREFRKERLAIYFEIASSEEFKKIVAFNCSSQATLDALKQKKLDKDSDSKKYIVTLAFTVLGVLATIFGAFYTYLSFLK
jgi:hypothetical protein